MPAETAVLRDNADLWAAYHKTKKQKNLTVEIYKIYKRHCNIDDLVAGRIPLKDYLGNQYADSFARRGADLWECPWDMVESISSTRARAWRIGLRLAATTLATAQVYNSPSTFKPMNQPIQRLSLSELLASAVAAGHSITVEDKRFSCSRCWISGMHSRRHLNKILARGFCKAVSFSKPIMADLGDPVPTGVSVDFFADETDPSALGEMDLNGHFHQLAPGQTTVPEPAAPHSSMQAETAADSREHRFCRATCAWV